MRIRNFEDVKVGHWFTYCCDKDLKQIETDDELSEVQTDLKYPEDEGMNVTVWTTKEAAMGDLNYWLSH